MSDTLEAVKLAQEIAAELGDEWQADEPNPLYGRAMAELHDADGTSLMVELYRDRQGGDRVELRASYDHSIYDHYPYDIRKDWPAKATVAVSRGAEAMARRFEKMIPTVRAFNAQARERKATTESRALTDHAIAVTLSEEFGNKREIPLRDKYGRHEMLDRFQASYFPYKVEVQNGRVTMELRDVTPEQARQIARILNDESQ